MASERTLDVTMHRHVFDTDRSTASVPDAIFGGTGYPRCAAHSRPRQPRSWVQSSYGYLSAVSYTHLTLPTTPYV